MGDLELSEVIFSIQNDLYNWGTRDHFLHICQHNFDRKGDYDGAFLRFISNR